MTTEEKSDSLDAYLDDQLDAVEREAFERELDHNPGLMAEVEKQRTIDESIRRLFPPPPTERLMSRLPDWATVETEADATDLRVVPTAGSAGTKHSPLRQWLGLAAAIGICVFAGVRFARFSESNVAADYSTMAGAYRTEVARGFEPLWVCRDDAEFSGRFEKRFGQPLVLGNLPSNIQSIGMSYASIISDKTTYLLAKVDGEEVVVFVDSETHKGQSLPSGSGLNLYSRQIESLILYEVSRLDRAYLLDAFHIPVDKP